MRVEAFVCMRVYYPFQYTHTHLAHTSHTLQGQEPPSALDLVRCIATARVVMPRSVIRLSAGRISFNVTDQALCFLSGANSIFDGDKLLTTPNNDRCADS